VDGAPTKAYKQRAWNRHGHPMFDIKWIRDNPREFDAGLTRRGLSPQAAGIIALDAERRKAVTAAQDIQSRRNALSKEIGAAKSKGDDAAGLIEKVASEKELQATAERQAANRHSERKQTHLHHTL